MPLPPLMHAVSTVEESAAAAAGGLARTNTEHPRITATHVRRSNFGIELSFCLGEQSEL
jgi:hypothetical protein